MDPEGHLYVGDSQNFSVRKLRTDGTVETVKYDLNVSKIFKPLALAYDHKGNILIADGENNKIIKINRKGAVKTVAGDGSKGFKDGSPLEATFNGPRGLTLDNYGNVIVADTDNHAIRVIYLSGDNKRVATIGGTGSVGYCDGNFMSSQFNKPYGVAVDAYDNILVADSRNNRIRIIHSDGTVSTVAGDGKEGFKDGLARCAQFNCPKGIAIDLSGDIIVSDGYNHSIRKIYSSYIQNSTMGLLKDCKMKILMFIDLFLKSVVHLSFEAMN
uniref:SMP-30/Gluconolactonase/LRE-like region domain-containing protein n=1 Tax=Arcella intermedia TaxID=1963864 RepID=A0A6B2LDK9_9EUKA